MEFRAGALVALLLAAGTAGASPSRSEWMPKTLADGSEPPTNWRALPAEGERLWLVGSCGRRATVATELVSDLEALWEQLQPPYRDAKRLAETDPARPQRVLVQAVMRACPEATSINVQFTQPVYVPVSLNNAATFPAARLRQMARGSKVFSSTNLMVADLSAYVDARTPARVDPDEAAIGISGAALRPEGAPQSPNTDAMAFQASFASAWALPGAAMEGVSVAQNRAFLERAVAEAKRADAAYPSDPAAAARAFGALSEVMDRAMKANDRKLAMEAADFTANALDKTHPTLMSDAFDGGAEQTAARQAWCQAVAVGRWTETIDIATFKALLVALATLEGSTAFPCSGQAAFTLGQLALANGDAAEAMRWLMLSPSPVARFVEGSLIMRRAVPGTIRDAYDRFAAGSAYAPAAINAASMALGRQVTGGWSDEEALQILSNISNRPGGPERLTAATLYGQYRYRGQQPRDHSMEFIAKFFAFSAAVEKFCEGRRCGSPEWLERQRSEALARDHARQRQQNIRRMDAGLEAMGGNPGALFACC